MKRRLTVVLCSAALSGLWSFAPALSQNAATSAVDSSPTVRMKDSSFQPQSTTVKVGQTVVFLNDDTVTHNVTESDKDINSGDIAVGKSWQYRFTKPGTYSYICTYHPWMKGEITAK